MNPIISIKNLKKHYGTNPVLKGINLEVEAGKIIGYIGPNGAGKSTTLKILTGIISDFEGDVTIMGINVRENPLEVKRRIGFIPENAMLYESLTPMEYLIFIGQLYEMTLTEIKKKAQDLLTLFGLGVNINQRMTNAARIFILAVIARLIKVLRNTRNQSNGSINQAINVR